MSGLETSSDGAAAAPVTFLYDGRNEIPWDVVRVRIDPSARAIPERAFEGRDLLEELELCEGLEDIGDGAFEGCASLGDTRFPSSLKTIGECAFSDCVRWEELELPGGLERVGDYAFQRCASLKKAKIPSTVERISQGAFAACDILEEVELCGGTKAIGQFAFDHCERLKMIKIPSTVRIIGHAAFSGCKQLEEFEIQEGLEKIEDEAIKYCRSLKKIVLPSTLVEIDDAAFAYCKQLVEVELLCNRLEKIGSEAFTNCISLQRIKIPSSVKIIGYRAFAECRQLVTVELCNGLQEIENGAFDYCPSLKNISIPPSAQTRKCFEGCHGLLRWFATEQKLTDALKSRFKGLPVHELCYYQSHHPSEETIWRFKNLDGKYSSIDNNDQSQGSQDCIGMNPLHILACSTKQIIDLYELFVSNNPRSLVARDKSGFLPIFYAIWGRAPEDIIQFLVESQMSVFPNIQLNWDEMISKLCRSGAPVEAVKILLRIKQASFPQQSVHWRNAAQELTVQCLVRCVYFSPFKFREVFLEDWGGVVELFREFNIQELTHHLVEIEETLFPDQNLVDDWQSVFEQFVQPLKDWWHFDDAYSLKVFRFFVACSIPERFHAIGVSKWHSDIQSMVHKIPFKSRFCTSFFGEFHSVVIRYENEYHRLEEASFLLELALWKAKYNQMQANTLDRDSVNQVEGSEGDRMRGWCHVNCGADIIIPNVLPYLIIDAIGHVGTFPRTYKSS